MSDVLCAVHSSVGTGPCARCGAFICESCTRGSAVSEHCERCGEFLSVALAQAKEAQRWAKWALFASFGGALLVLAGMIADSLLLAIPGILSWLLGGPLGVLALVVGRGAQAPDVRARAFSAIALALIALLLIAYVVSTSMGV